MDAFATTGRIQHPLITVAGTMDSLLPFNHHARAYARKVAAARDEDTRNAPAYRLYEVQNGNHIDAYKPLLAQREYIEPHARRAFNLLVDHVKYGASLPPEQCVSRGGAIGNSPIQPGHCESLLAP